MGWYLVVRKDLIDDPKLITWAARILKADPDCLGPGTALDLGRRRLLRHALLGAIVTLWRYADRDVLRDNSLPVTLDGVTEIMGVTQAWIELMPEKWLTVDPGGRVILPRYCEENNIKGRDLRQSRVSDTKREQAAERQRRKRQRERDTRHAVTHDTSRKTSRGHAVTVPPTGNRDRTPVPVGAALTSAQAHFAQPAAAEPDPERKPNGHPKPPPAKTPEQLAVDARKLAATGLTTSEVHRHLAQFGATLEQTAEWLMPSHPKTAQVPS
jgi:hypothetical protein